MKTHPSCSTLAGMPVFGNLFSFSLLGIAALPVCLLLLPNAAEVVYTLVSITGLICLLRNGLSNDESRTLFLISLLPLLFFGVAALSVVVSGDNSGWFRPLKKLSELLATPFIALLLLRANIPARHFMLAAKFSALMLFTVALYQFLILHNSRPGGAVSPLPFGHISLLLGFFSLICLPLENTRQKLFSLAAFSAGCLATILSQARIEWINIFFLLAALLLVWYRSGLLTKHTVQMIGSVTLLLLIFAINMPFAQNRVTAALDDYQAFNNQQVWNSSVGQRFVMWQSGLAAAAEKPVFGWGIHRSQQAAVAELSDPKMKQAIGEHHNLHNEYVNTLASKGIVGLASLFALLFIPMTAFYARSSNPDLLVFNASGILLCVAYTVSGMTFQAFGDDAMNIFFVIVLSYSLTSVLGRPAREQCTQDRPDCCGRICPVTSEQ